MSATTDMTQGKPAKLMLSFAIPVILNIVLDLLFVMGLHLGVFGAALASVLSQLCAFLYCLNRLRSNEYVCLDHQAFVWDWKLTGEILAFGLPLAIQYIIIQVGGMIVRPPSMCKAAPSSPVTPPSTSSTVCWSVSVFPWAWKSCIM